MSAAHAAGLVAAAGQSARMGRAKALLLLDDGRTFVGALVDTFLAAGLAPVVVTVPEPPDDAPVRAALAAHDDRVVVVRNAWPADGLAGSVRTTLAHLARGDDYATLVLAPVDAPFARAHDVADLLAAVSLGAPAAALVHAGERGHPVAFSLAALRRHDRALGDGGPRAVLAALGDDVRDVVVDDARVLLNVNRPEDLARLRGWS